MPDRKAEQKHFQVPPVASLRQIYEVYNPTEKHHPSNPLHKKVNGYGQEVSEPTKNQLTQNINGTREATVHQLYHQLHPEKFNKK